MPGLIQIRALFISGSCQAGRRPIPARANREVKKLARLTGRIAPADGAERCTTSLQSAPHSGPEKPEFSILNRPVKADTFLDMYQSDSDKRKR